MRSSTDVRATVLRWVAVLVVLAVSAWTQGGGVITGVPPRPPAGSSTAPGSPLQNRTVPAAPHHP
jgi:hypothetical protein